MADNTGAVPWSGSYADYGTPYDEVGTPQTMYGFTGEPTNETGLVHLRARDYNPGLGIFTALDPFEGVAQRPMSLNGYSWVEGNVPNAGDPSGLCAQPTQWWNPIDANCYYSAVALAHRFGGSAPSTYQTWFDVLIQRSWEELKAIEALSKLNDAAILPQLLVQNPQVTGQALGQLVCNTGGFLPFIAYVAQGVLNDLPGIGLVLPELGLPSWLLELARDFVTILQIAQQSQQKRPPVEHS
ncbi:MAG: hypothetical protein KJ065_11790 [Anaerolineae bacterium]|nr:hypothetical protein [Anaerolineae bacterium]